MTLALSLWKGVIDVVPTMRAITEGVAERHGLSFEDIMGRSRRRPIAVARAEAMHKCRSLTKHSTPVIGRFFNCHHTTIHYAVKAHLVHLMRQERHDALDRPGF